MLKRDYPRVDADEIVQATYLRLMATGEVEHVTNGKYYFFMAARSVVRDHARRDRTAGLEPFDLLTIEVAADEPGIEQVVDSRRALRRLQDAVRELPDRQRLVVEMRRIDGLDVRTTAKALTMSVSAVEKHQTHAMRHLAAVMARPGAEHYAASGRLGRPARSAR